MCPKTIYFGVKRSKVKVTRHKKTVSPVVFALLQVPAYGNFPYVLEEQKYPAV